MHIICPQAVNSLSYFVTYLLGKGVILTVSRKTRYIRRSLRRIQRWTCKFLTAFLTCEKKCGLLSILVRFFVVLGIGMQNRI